VAVSATTRLIHPPSSPAASTTSTAKSVLQGLHVACNLLFIQWTVYIFRRY
jgi:hypothetical protein